MIYNLNDKEFEVENIINKRRRSLALKVVLPNKLEIYSPYPLKQDDIDILLSRHKRFVLNRISSLPIDDNSIQLLGKSYKLNIIDSDINQLLVDDYLNEIRVYTKSNNDNYIFRIIDNYYKDVLLSIVNKNIDEIKNRMDIKFNIDFRFKRVSSYFGECFSKRNIVILNTKLAKYELKYILSVIYHELAHFYYQNHQKGFYKMLDNVFPNYKKIQAELRRIKYNDKY